MREITELLKMAVERNASDLHVKVGSHPIMRVHGNLERMESEPAPVDRRLQAGLG